MTREYDIKNAAWDYFQDLDSHHFQILPHCNPQTDAFEAGAKWADETMIERAVDWLCMNMTSIEYFGINGNIIKPDFIQRFKKAMKEE